MIINIFRNLFYLCAIFLSIIVLSSCGAYQHSILFKTDGNIDNAKFAAAIANSEKNYVVRKFDFLGINIFTNKGETLLDPNGEIKMTAEQTIRVQQNMGMASGVSGVGGMQNMQQGALQGGVIQAAFPRYEVNERGVIIMPIIGEVKLEGLTLFQVDSLMTIQFAKYYKEVFAISRLLNRRVVVLGALGNRILPLANENMNIVEVISMAGNLGISARADNIRLIRNVTSKPEIQVINLTTWEGLKAANLRVEPNDIIYIEPRRRVYRQETLQDIGAVVGTIGGLFGSLASVAALLVLAFK